MIAPMIGGKSCRVSWFYMKKRLALVGLQNAWDRAVYPWLIDFTPSRPMSPTLPIQGDEDFLGDNQGAEKPLSDVNWLGIGFVGVGMVGTFGGLYWLVNSPKASTSDGPSGSPVNADGDSSGTTTPSVVVTSPLSLRENHVGLFMTAQAQGLAAARWHSVCQGPMRVFLLSIRELVPCVQSPALCWTTTIHQIKMPITVMMLSSRQPMNRAFAQRQPCQCS